MGSIDVADRSRDIDDALKHLFRMGGDVMLDSAQGRDDL